MSRVLRLAVAAAVVVGTPPRGGAPIWAQAAAPVVQQITEAQSQIAVGAGDVIAIGVFPVDEYSREVTVQPDGKIELPLIGAVMVQGLNSRDIQNLLETKYTKFVTGPKITVNVRRFVGRRVSILGQIGAPGYYEFRDGMRLLDLVSLAGGPRDLAKPSKTLVLRQGGDKPRTLKVNLSAVLRGEMDRNLALMPGDTVIVPKASYTKGAEWLTHNILPWVSVATLITSIVIVSRR